MNLDRDALFIGGEWVAPATSQTIEVISPFTEEVVGITPEATEADVDRAVAAAHRGVRAGPLAPVDARRAGADMINAISAGILGRMDEMAEPITAETALPRVLPDRPGAGPDHALHAFAGYVHTYPFQELGQAFSGRTRSCARPRSACLRHRALERAAVHHPRVRPGPDLGLHRGPQAGARDPARRLRARRDRPRPACPPASSTSCPPVVRSASTS